MPQLGQVWSTSAKLQEMASQRQTGGIGVAGVVRNFFCEDTEWQDLRVFFGTVHDEKGRGGSAVERAWGFFAPLKNDRMT
jgi:hypothetical protein